MAVSWRVRQPLNLETPRRPVAQLGISAITLRVDALIDLAAGIPPSLLADLVGLHPAHRRTMNTCRSSRASYVAERSHAIGPTECVRG